MDVNTYNAIQMNLATASDVIQATQKILAGTAPTESTVTVQAEPVVPVDQSSAMPSDVISGDDPLVVEIENQVDYRAIPVGHRSVSFGINTYPGCPLTGCVPDARNWARFAVNKLGVPKKNTRIVLNTKATRKGMWEQLQWAKQNLKAGDKLVITYSGHGAQDAGPGSESEPDRLNEVWCCQDFAWTPDTEITDKDLYEYVKSLPEGVECFIVSDSCHSGDFFTRSMKRNNPVKGVPRSYPIMPSHVHTRLVKSRQNMYRAMKFGLPDVVYLSGCRADQTSADTQDPQGNPCGALSYFALKHLYADMATKKMCDLTLDIVSELHANDYEQTPQCEGPRRQYILLQWND